MIYDMAGVFIQPLLGNGVFIGNDLIHNEENNILEGKLYDVYGESLIKGNLDFSKGVMEFDKTYEGAKTIQYKLREQKGIWIGEFFWKGNSHGESMCEIFEKEKNPKFNWNEIAKMQRMSIEGMERYSQDILDRMAQKGYMEIIKDSKSGEDLIQLTNKGKKLVPKEFKNNYPKNL